VIFGLVGENDSFARAWVMAFHLVNTFLLLAGLTLCAWWTGDNRPLRFSNRSSESVFLLTSLVTVLMLGISGAIAALGDTLFPSVSLSEALEEDFSQGAHLLIRLRIYHPFIAVLGTLIILSTAYFLARNRPDSTRVAALTGLLFLTQMGIGIVNLLLLAPAWLQLRHLLFADLIWITMICFASSTLAAENLLDNASNFRSK
jgi:heme A synthase